MKTKTLLFLFSIMVVFAFGQNTEPFHYQGILRDAEGELLSKQDFDIRVFIIDEGGSGLILFSEEQTLTTDEFGQFSTTVGQMEELPDLYFDNETYFLKVEVNHDGRGYVDAGGSIIRPTPFASTASQAHNLSSLDLGGIRAGQTIKWDGVKLVPANDDGESYRQGEGIVIKDGLISNIGDTDPDDDIKIGDAAGGVLSGTFPNVSLKQGSITADKLAQMGATDGQVLTWTGSTWTPMANSEYWKPRWIFANGQLRLNSLRFEPGAANSTYTEIGTDYIAIKPHFFPSWKLQVIANQMNLTSGNYGLQFKASSANSLVVEAASNSKLVLGSTNRPIDNIVTNRVNFGINSRLPTIQARYVLNTLVLSRSNTSTSLELEFNNSGNRGSLEPGGNITFNLGSPSNRFNTLYSVTSVSTSSDRRLKDDISDLHYGLSHVMSLRPVNYTFKSDMENEVHLGFIAQDVQEVIPEVVQVSESDPAREDGIKNPLGMTYTELIPVLVKAIQEQQEEIEELRNRLVILENQ